MAVGEVQLAMVDSARVAIEIQNFSGDKVVANLSAKGSSISGDTAADGAGDSGTVGEISDRVFDGFAGEVLHQGVTGDGDAGFSYLNVRNGGAETNDSAVEAGIGNNEIGALADEQERDLFFIESPDERGKLVGGW